MVRPEEYKIFKQSHMEYNPLPSQLNTSAPADGVQNRLTPTKDNAPQFDGVTIEQMRNNPLYDRVSDIDKVGLAQKKVAEAAKAVDKSKFVRALRKQSQRKPTPKN